jgi:hypothetical protein
MTASTFKTSTQVLTYMKNANTHAMSIKGGAMMDVGRVPLKEMESPLDRNLRPITGCTKLLLDLERCKNTSKTDILTFKSL